MCNCATRGEVTRPVESPTNHCSGKHARPRLGDEWICARVNAPAVLMHLDVSKLDARPRLATRHRDFPRSVVRLALHSERSAARRECNLTADARLEIRWYRFHAEAPDACNQLHGAVSQSALADTGGGPERVAKLPHRVIRAQFLPLNDNRRRRLARRARLIRWLHLRRRILRLESLLLWLLCDCCT